ncbi:hypothetical protein NDA01_19710 [Trichocoleus desertorum AS-A10]|uniref:hypothetical protein n=1 Tax=Trichocoleus desertorum TaxID=1481672 RepID=UPI003297ECCF
MNCWGQVNQLVIALFFPLAIAPPLYDSAHTPRPHLCQPVRGGVALKKAIAPASTLQGRSLTFWNLILLCFVSHYT